MIGEWKEGERRMKRKGVILLLALILAMTCRGSMAEGIKSCAMLDHAFTLLEEGNPFLERYNRLTGGTISARLPQGVPYFWGGRAESHLFAKEPDYIVQAAWQSSPTYYRAGTKYIYGFDCVGFVKWVWEKVYKTEMPGTGTLLSDRGHHLRDAKDGEGPVWDGWEWILIPGDILVLDHHPGHHIAIYAGTLRLYGYTAEEVPILADRLDDPLVIHCTVNAQIADRFADLIANGLPKYKAATVTDGGVSVSLVVSDPETVPGLVHQQKQDTRYYELPDGTWLTVLVWEKNADYCWYRVPEKEE